MSSAADADGIVSAFGDVVNTAIAAYHSNEELRETEVRSLQKELEEAKQREAELRALVGQMKAESEAAIAAIRQLPLVRFDLPEVAGTWFSNDLQRRVIVAENGLCSYDDGSTQQICMADGRLVLAGAHTLSVAGSTRKRLIWEGATTLTWTREDLGGSGQVLLTLDITEVLFGYPPQNRGYTDKKPQRSFAYPFSLMGCNVHLLMCRNQKGLDGNIVEGEQSLGIHFGLRKAEVNENSIDALTCTTRIEFWDVSKHVWVQVDRRVAQRYEAGDCSIGKSEALTFERFRQIVGPAVGDRYHLQRHFVRVRVTMTDIDLLELSRSTGTPLGPDLE